MSQNHSKPFAFFDIDGVLVKPYVIQKFPKYLASLNPPRFSRRELDTMVQQYQAYRVHKDYGKFATQWVETYARGIEGQQVKSIESSSKQFWKTHWNQLVYSYTEELVKTLAVYCNVIAVSGSPKEGLLPFVEQLGIPTLKATEAEIKDHVFTGKVKVAGNAAVREAKDAVILEYIDLITDRSVWDRSFAFGDTNHDGPLLRYVGNPFLITDYDTDDAKTKAKQTFTLLHYIRQLHWFWRPEDNNYIVPTVKMRLRTIGLI